MKLINNFITFCDDMIIAEEGLESKLTSSIEIKKIIQNVTDYVNLLFSTKYKSFQSKYVLSYGINNSKTINSDVGFFYALEHIHRWINERLSYMIVSH